MAAKTHFALVALVLAASAATAEPPEVSALPPLADSEKRTWSRFAASWNLWNRAQETDYTARELRASLPGISTGDIAWVLAERDFNEGLLAASHSSPEYLLLEAPELRLAGKAIAEVASLEYGMPSTPESPAPGMTEAQMWSSLEETLGDVASLRSAAPVKVLLWLRVAQDLDRQAWHETSMTAHDLLSAPDYGLARKIIADGLTETIINCVRLGPDLCKFAHDTTMDWCAVVDAAWQHAAGHVDVDFVDRSPPNVGPPWIVFGTCSADTDADDRAASLR